MSVYTLILTIILISLTVWLGIITYLILRQNAFFHRFTEGITKNDLKTILRNIAASLKTIGSEIHRLDTETKTIIKENRTHLQKIGFIRYNPFSDTGGDQSFCLALLDQNDDGILVTSMHSREQTRIYAKVVSHGQAKGYEFSKEEAQTVDLAVKRKVMKG